MTDQERREREERAEDFSGEFKRHSPFWYNTVKFVSDPRTLATTLGAAGLAIVHLQTKVAVLESNYRDVRASIPVISRVETIRADETINDGHIELLEQRVGRLEQQYQPGYLDKPKIAGPPKKRPR